MTTEFDPNKNKDLDPTGSQTQGDTSNSGPMSVSGSEAQTNTAPTGNTSPKPTSSGRFTNLNAYLKANSGFNQDQGGLAGRVTGKFQQTGDLINNNIQNTQNAFQQQADQHRIQYDPNIINNALQNAPAYTQNQDNIDQFAKQRDAQYTGPTQMDADTTVKAQLDSYGQLANQTNSEAGRFNLLRQMFNKPTYTSGQQALDNLFLQGNPSQLGDLNKVRQTANSSLNNYNNAANQAAMTGQNYSNEAMNARNQTRDALDNAFTGFDTSMGTSMQDALNQRQSKFDQEQTNLQDLKLSSDDASKFGLLNTLGDKESGPVYNLNLGSYLTQGNVDPTKQTVASQADYDRIQALSKLAGNTLQGQNASLVDSFNNPTLAGSFQKENPYNFNNAAFQNDLGQADSAYHDKADPYEKAIADAHFKLYGGLNGARESNGGFEGGLNGEVQRLGSTLKQQMQDAYNQQLANYQAMGMDPSNINVPNPGNLSNEQIFAQYGLNNNVVNNDTYKRLKDTRQTESNYTDWLKQLQNASGYNRKVQMTDADKYKPVDIAPSGSNTSVGGLPGSGDISSSAPVGSQNADRLTDAQIAALKNLST